MQTHTFMIHKRQKKFGSSPLIGLRALNLLLWSMIFCSNAHALNLICDDNGLIEAFSQAYAKELKSWALADPSISAVVSEPQLVINVIDRDEPIPFPKHAPLYTLFDSAIGGGGELVLFEKLINPIECFLTVEIKIAEISKEISANKPYITKIKGSYRLPPKLKNRSQSNSRKRKRMT